MLSILRRMHLPKTPWPLHHSFRWSCFVHQPMVMLHSPRSISGLLDADVQLHFIFLSYRRASAPICNLHPAGSFPLLLSSYLKEYHSKWPPQATPFLPSNRTICTATLHTAHSTLSTLHFTLYTLPSTHHTLYVTRYTPHSLLHTLHSTLHTLHSTLYASHSTLYTLHSTLYTLHFTLYTYTPHSTL